MTPDILHAVLAARTAGRAIVLATRLADGFQLILPESDAPQPVLDAAALALARDESAAVELGGEAWFMQVHAPAYRLIVVGAVHIAQALVPLAAALGYAVTVVDPRRSFNSPERFPGVIRAGAWPDEALDDLKPDARTAIVTLTHDPKLDDPALDRALRSHAFFIGSLGSRRTHAQRLERLAALGHGPATLARIRGPVGLAIGAISAPEIALSIVAEIVAVRRGAALANRH
jgi:xanthine dehydrogenase accessory factor